jgi:nitrile hydratase
MDGIHDLGGRQGFGAIDVDEPEEPFHEPWEGRVRGMVNAMSKAADWNIDWFRHCRELIDPVDYLSRPYFDQWLQTYAAMLVNSGIATVDEIASGHPTTQPPNLRPPMTSADVQKAKTKGPELRA